LNRLVEVDARQNLVRRVAADLRRAALGSEARFARLCQVYAQTVPYQTDVERTGSEDIAGLTRAYASPLEPVLLNSADDCDTKARLCASLALAGGLRARLEGLTRTETRSVRPGLTETAYVLTTLPEHELDHVYPVLTVDGVELPAETIFRRAQLGEAPLSVPREENKTWLQ
jgi:hypothetical protein